MANNKILQMAWILDNSNLHEPWFHNDDIVYYGTRGQAKLQAIPDNDAGKLANGGEITFLTIKVKRYRQGDVIDFHGKSIKRWELKGIQRQHKISLLRKNKFYYVQDNRSNVGNAVLWWGLNGNGYVTDLSKAHKYSYDEILHFYPRESDIIWESEHVESAIRQYVDMQGLNKDFSL